MEEALVLETSFIVDLEREKRALLSRRLKAGAGRRSPAHDFLARHASARLHLSMTTVGEIAAGVHDDKRPRWEELVQPFALLPMTADVCWEYGMAFRYLAGQRRLIGSNDLWIAAAALANGLPLVTRDVDHFRRVPGLRVISYT